MTTRRAGAGGGRMHLVLLLALLLGACAGDPPNAPTNTSAATLQIEVVAEGLSGPTAMARHPDGRLLVAEIGAGEGTPTGTVAAIDVETGARTVLVGDLDTPTGLAIAGDHLWVMERTQLSRVALSELSDTGASATPVLVDLPSNGRSNGSLTATAAGDLVYNTSGRREGFGAAAGSGRLWLLPGGRAEAEPRELLSGMKHAYAVAELADGTLAVTEIGDGRFDGAVPQDEIVLLPPPADGEEVPSGGWPRCIDDRVPVIELDGTPAICAETLRPHALLPQRATPTGIAAAPWDPDQLVVAEWVTGRLVTVPIAGADSPHEPVLLAEIESPQDLLADTDRLLVTSHAAGSLLALSR